MPMLAVIFLLDRMGRYGDGMFDRLVRKVEWSGKNG